MLNFSGIPCELEEAALLMTTVRPVSGFMCPVLSCQFANVHVICFITHWNSYFWRIIFPMESYPLVFPYTVVVQRDMSLWVWNKLELLVDDRNYPCQYVFTVLIPIMLIYPLPRSKYFCKGMTVGSCQGYIISQKARKYVKNKKDLPKWSSQNLMTQTWWIQGLGWQSSAFSYLLCQSGGIQTAYQIIAASSRELLEEGGFMGQRGKSFRWAKYAIVYGGLPLQSRQVFSGKHGYGILGEDPSPWVNRHFKEMGWRRRGLEGCLIGQEMIFNGDKSAVCLWKISFSKI